MGRIRSRADRTLCKCPAFLETVPSPAWSRLLPRIMTLSFIKEPTPWVHLETCHDD